MTARYEYKPPGHDAHHIVPNADPRGAITRDILAEAGINYRNAPENGVYLPRTSMDPGTVPEALTRHPTVHTTAYYQELTLVLLEAKGNGTVPETLAWVKDQLKNGKFRTEARGGTRGQRFAEWVMQHKEDFYWMTPEELEAVAAATRRRPRSGLAAPSGGLAPGPLPAPPGRPQTAQPTPGTESREDHDERTEAAPPPEEPRREGP
jgi:hypothetical protein